MHFLILPLVIIFEDSWYHLLGCEELAIIGLLEKEPSDETREPPCWLITLANSWAANSASSLVDFCSRVDSMEDFEVEYFSSFSFNLFS